MANVTAAKQGNPGSVQEGANFKRTQKITFQNIIDAGTYSDNDTVTFTIPVAAGEEITRAGVKLVTAFNDSGSGDELGIEVGDGTDPNGYITAAVIHVDGTEITWVSDSGAYIEGGDAGDRGKLYLADDTIDILITPNAATGDDYSLAELTAGELVVTVIGHSYA